MKMSELIEMMQDAMNKYGDLEIEIRDSANGVSYFGVGAYEDHAFGMEIEDGVNGSFTITYDVD